MTTGLDQACRITGKPGQARPEPASALPPMTPETARRLAAILAPHLAPMRAVTAGTRYDCGGEDEAGQDVSPSLARVPRVSPSTKIFIEGTLQHDPVPA